MDRGLRRPRIGRVFDPGRLKAAAFAPLIIVGAAFVVFCVVDVVRAARVRYLPKWAWALICVASVPLGGIVYLIVGRER